jgi:hypothetical protein
LTGCVGFGQPVAKDSRVQLAVVPGDIRACLKKEMAPPPPNAKTREEVAEYIAAFRKHDVAKTHCGKRVIAWYDAQAARYAK